MFRHIGLYRLCIDGLGFSDNYKHIFNPKEIMEDWKPRYLTEKQNAVLEYIQKHIQKHGVAFPRQIDIANNTGLSRETVNRTIKKLLKLKYIERKLIKERAFKCGMFLHEVKKDED